MRARWMTMAVVLGLAVAACGGGDDTDTAATTATTAASAADSAAPAATQAPTTIAAPSTDAPTTTAAPTTTQAPTTTVAPEPVWEEVVAPADCMCSDGSEFSYYVRAADPARVVFYMEGGGACFSAETCGPTSSTFNKRLPDVPAGGDPTSGQGIFEMDNPANPFAGWTFVYVPYCTGDVHLGNATTDYGDGVVIEHKGSLNANAALAGMAERFPEIDELVVTGVSAGSIPSPLMAGLAADLYPETRITVFGDGSGAYPDVPVVNETIGAFWGTANTIPDWPGAKDKTPATWSLPGLWVVAFQHAPQITFARHDFAFDNTQASFSALAGIPADQLDVLIDQNETQIEAGGVNLLSFISPGDQHTISGKPDFYTHTVEGVSLVEWVRALVEGKAVEDVHCTVCTA